MRKKLFTLMGLLSFSLMVMAQESKVHKIDFASFNSAGFIAGESSSELQVQTVNGVTWKGWFLGAGVGLDYYNVRSIPVFGEVRKQVFDKDHSPYIYASVGHHYIWLKKESMWETDHEGGLYYDFGIGYEVSLKKIKNAYGSKESNIKSKPGPSLFISAGYSGKEYSKKQDSFPWMSIWPRSSDSYKTMEYKDTRISVKVGLRL